MSPSSVAAASDRGGSDPRPALAATVGALLAQGHDGAIDIHEGLRAIASLGYRSVQWPATVAPLRPRDLDGSARRGVRGELARLELRFAGVDVWVPGAHLLDPARMDRAVAALAESVRFAADVRGRGGDEVVVSVLLPSAEERRAGAEGGRQLDAAIAELAREAERAGVLLADHSPNGPDGSDLAGIGVGIDPALLLAAGRDPVECAISAGPRLASARLADLLRSGLRGPILEPGEGRLDVPAYRAALDVVGYRRDLVVDARQWLAPLAGLRATIERWAGGPLRPPQPASRSRTAPPRNG